MDFLLQNKCSGRRMDISLQGIRFDVHLAILFHAFSTVRMGMILGVTTVRNLPPSA
jgi:hypothetical protein